MRCLAIISIQIEIMEKKNVFEMRSAATYESSS